MEDKKKDDIYISIINSGSVYEKFKNNVKKNDDCKIYYWIPYIKLISLLILPFCIQKIIKDKDIFNSFITTSIIIFIVNLLYIVLYVLPYREQLIKISNNELKCILKCNNIFYKPKVIEFLLNDSKEVKDGLRATIKSLSKSSFISLIAAIPIYINFLYKSSETQVVAANEYASIVIFSTMVVISLIIDMIVILGEIPMKLLYNLSLESNYIKNLKN